MTTEPSRHPVRSFRRSLPALVLVAGLTATLALCAWAMRATDVQRDALLARRVAEFSQALSTRIQSYVDTLPGLRVFGVLSKSPTDAEFRRYVEAISLQNRFPGLALTFVAERVRDADVERYDHAVRADRSLDPAGHPGFHIVPEGVRPEYMVLRHLYPADPAITGYDLYDPKQSYKSAVDEATDNGLYVATGPLLLAHDRFEQPRPELTSVVIRAATYAGELNPGDPKSRREALAGVVGISFRTTEIVRSVLPPELAGQARIRITDSRALREGRNGLIFDSDWGAGTRGPDADSAVAAAFDIEVANRPWHGTVVIAPATIAASADSTTWLLLILGAALSVSLSVMTRTLVRANVVAEERVRAATGALMEEKANLEHSEMRYRMLFDNSLDAVLRTRPDGAILAANPAACALLGYSEEALRTLGRQAVVDPSDPRLDVLLQARTVAGRARGLIAMVRSDGTRIEAEVASNTYVDDDGTPVASLFIRDVTERQVLAERQARQAAILDATPDFVGSTDPAGHNIYLNRAARKMLGRGEDEDVSDLGIADCHPPWATRLILDEGIPAALLHGVWTGSTAIRARDGREIPVLQVILCHRNDRGEVSHLSTIARDVTELKRAEEERQVLEGRLRESQKMESIGTLAGGVAHDFNNVLVAILGSVVLARQEIAPGHPAHELLVRISQAAIRARALVHQILTFSRRTPPDRLVQALNPVIEEAIAFLRVTLPATVALEVILPPEPIDVLVDAAQIHQVLMNLCTNAWQALPDSRGHVTVTLARVALHAAAAATLSLPPGSYARLRVRDDGAGMDEATRLRVFEPFFTTKPVGQGTGLGLAVVHGIVAASGGAISISSTRGAGTSVEIHLPVASGPRQVELSVKAGKDAPPGHGEHVVIVDDDEVVRMTLEALLERGGYRVTSFAGGAAALDAIGRDGQRFQLVVTDYNMPGMSGLAIAEALRQTAPRLPVIVTSGYVDDNLLERARAVGVSAVMLKEHSTEQLLHIVARTLNDSRRQAGSRRPRKSV